MYELVNCKWHSVHKMPISSHHYTEELPAVPKGYQLWTRQSIAVTYEKRWFSQVVPYLKKLKIVLLLHLFPHHIQMGVWHMTKDKPIHSSAQSDSMS